MSSKELQSLARHENSEIFSAKAAISTSVIGAALVACARQLEAGWGISPVRSVFILSIICALPFAVREFFASKGTVVFRIPVAFLALLAAWHVLFQTTRGSSATYDTSQELPAHMETAPSVGQVLPNTLPVAAMGLSVFEFDLSALGGGTPFRPIFRSAGQGKYEVLVYYKGKTVWMQNVQDTSSKRW